MNIFLHFLINYSVVKNVFSITKNYIPIIFLASSFLDLDHIPYTIKNYKEILKEKKVRTEVRTGFHELSGLIILSTLLFLGYFFFDKNIIQATAFCVVSHIAFDFLTVDTRPYFPFDKRIINLNFMSRKNRIVLEIIITLIWGVIFVQTL